MTQEMYEKAVNKYSFSLIHVSNCYKTQNVCGKVIDMCTFLLDYILNCFKKQEVAKEHFVLKIASIYIRHKNCVTRLLMLVCHS